MAHSQGRTDTTVAIIGAGISGLCTAIDLVRHNNFRDFVILERGLQVGGTWNDNTYPGCCCDVWSHLYSFSFAQNPNWSREYSSQKEIHRYLIDVAEKWGLYQHIRFNSTVTEARWNDEDSQWGLSIEIGGGKEAEYGAEYLLQADFLVSGTGQLNQPAYPDITGLESFAGKIMHSARWDWGYSLRGKRVGIVGNGATAAQIVPEVAKECKDLVIFQRTANWIIPRGDKSIGLLRRAVYSYFPLFRQRYRSRLMDIRESLYRATYVPDTEEKDTIRRDCLQMMEKQIPTNQRLRNQLTPSYPPGCKRVIVSDDYYPALNEAHVALETRPISQISSSGVRVGENGMQHDLDCLILATGFKTQNFLFPIKVYGRNGRSLPSIWQNGPQALCGTTVESLPNFAMLYGPNTNLGHNSIILMIEAQSRYINALITKLLQAKSQGLTLVMSPEPQAVKEYNQWIQERLAKSTFSDPSCNSWYKDNNGKVVNNWCGTVVEYQKMMSVVKWRSYEKHGSGAYLIDAEATDDLGRVVEESTRLRFVTDIAFVTCSITLAVAFLLQHLRFIIMDW